ncbi:MAG: T9SS type A sorting domain-containing protein [Bacteroidales bacterium]|nr:T9SS type A sorting domain-containing protein [Bacteroidales bacterium]
MKKVCLFIVCMLAIGFTQAQRYYEGWEKYNHNIKMSPWKVVDKIVMRSVCADNSKGWQINVAGNTVNGVAISTPTGGDTNKNSVTFACGGAPNKGTDSWLISPLIKGIKDGDYLSFYMTNFSGSENCNFEVLVSATGSDDTSAFKPLGTYPAYRNNVWASFSYSLADYVGKDIRIAFRAYLYPTASSMFEFGGIFGVDQIRIGEVNEYDMEFVEMLSPELPMQNVDSAVPMTIVVRNKGHKVDEFDVWYLKSSDVASWRDKYAFAKNFKVKRSLNTLDTMHVTFPKGLQFRKGIRDTLIAWVDIPADLDRTNDTMPATLADNVSPAGVPYTNSFDSAADISGIRFFNIRKDESTWKDVNTVFYSRRGEGCMEYAGNTKFDANDWFFTKMIYFEDKKEHEVRYWYAASDPSKPQKLIVAWAYQQKYQSLMWELSWHENIVNKAGEEDAEHNRGYLEGKARFKIEKPGYYYIGFKCASPASTGKLYLDDISVQIAVGVAESSEDRTVSVYPNPAQEQLRIVSPNGIRSVEIFNTVGQRVYSCNGSDNQMEVNVRDFANGLYVVKTVTEKGYSTQKINVMH